MHDVEALVELYRERHLDLVDLLQTRFGISTRINEDNSVEFHDETSTP